MPFQLKKLPAYRTEAELPEKDIPHRKQFNVEKSNKK
jgi:hypothetical protein